MHEYTLWAECSFGMLKQVAHKWPLRLCRVNIGQEDVPVLHKLGTEQGSGRSDSSQVVDMVALNIMPLHKY
jgi:hypothetical protein